MSDQAPTRDDELVSPDETTTSSSSRGQPGPAQRVLRDDGEARRRPARAVDRLRRPPARPAPGEVPAPPRDTSFHEPTHGTHEYDDVVTTADTTWSQANAEPVQLDEPPGTRGGLAAPLGQPVPQAVTALPERAPSRPPAASPAKATPPAATGDSPRGRPSRTVLLPVVVVLALAGVVGAVVLGVLAASRGNRLDAQQNAVEAARRLGEQVTSYDYESISQDVEGVRAASVDPFRAAYDERADDLRRRVEATRAQATGTVIAAGLQDLEKDRAEVLLFINQTLRGTDVDGQRVEPIRALMTLRRRGGSWRLANLQVG